MSALEDLVRTILQAEESTRLVVYDDKTGKPIVPGSVVVGHPTIGTGRALDTHGISPSESAAMLVSDIDPAVHQVSGVIGDDIWPGLDLGRQAGLVGMAFQLGAEGVARFPAMIAAIRAGNWQAAHDAALDSAWARETPARAQRVATALLTGTYPAVR